MAYGIDPILERLDIDKESFEQDDFPDIDRMPLPEERLLSEIHAKEELDEYLDEINEYCNHRNGIKKKLHEQLEERLSQDRFLQRIPGNPPAHRRYSDLCESLADQALRDEPRDHSNAKEGVIEEHWDQIISIRDDIDELDQLKASRENIRSKRTFLMDSLEAQREHLYERYGILGPEIEEALEESPIEEPDLHIRVT